LDRLAGGGSRNPVKRDGLRTCGFPPGLGAPLSLFRDDVPLKAHPDYRAAKSGEPAAAVKLVMDLAEPLVDRVR
jgi:hypothetical protein